MLTRRTLVRIKVKALRCKVWFGAASALERAIVDLTIHCVERVRSRVLAQILLKVVSKILKTLENGFMDKAETVGHEIAVRLCSIAEGWGREECFIWRNDRAFFRFLGVNALNKGE